MLKQSGRAQRILLPLLNCGCIVLLWQVAVIHRWISPLSLASPFEAAKVAFGSFNILLPHILATTYATALTFVLSSAGGMLLGALLMHWRRFRLAIYPSLVMFQLLPKIANAGKPDTPNSVKAKSTAKGSCATQDSQTQKEK